MEVDKAIPRYLEGSSLSLLSQPAACVHDSPQTHVIPAELTQMPVLVALVAGLASKAPSPMAGPMIACPTDIRMSHVTRHEGLLLHRMRCLTWWSCSKSLITIELVFFNDEARDSWSFCGCAYNSETWTHAGTL